MSLASQNRFAFLGNDDDGENKPIAPVRTVDKASTHTTKRNADGEAPVKGAATGNRRGPGGNEGAFRDRNAGSSRNQGKSTEETPRDGPRGGAGARVRGGRGGRNPRSGEDRRDRTGRSTTDKQTASGWGATEGNAELKDEQAGEAIAQGEKAAEDGAEEEAEPEDKSVSYADYLAQQAEKKLNLGELKTRGANEGSKVDKKWESAVALDTEEEEFIAAGAGKKLRERERKVKQTIDFDPRFVEPERPARGGARGGRDNRESRGPREGGRGGRGGRGGERAPRGGDRAPRGDAPRRGGASINTKDESAFPSLGK
ncbi:Putative Elicitor protein [[Torrubiella] hemipterigena]|uniref:Putative Elicitor protein n=1 Tax=[Torrubiella] hemipterigena TaxID=1531966 RepID=A0A0A1SNL5_9HYPO|nr:Putative Elicitor protein [[Torrubiella] hemipterigena]